VQRKTLHLIVALLGCVNLLSYEVISTTLSKGWSDVLMTTFGVSIVVWLAIVLASRLVLKSSVEPAGKIDYGLACIACLLYLIPSSFVASVAMGTYTLIQVFRRHASARATAGLLIFLIIAWRGPLINLLFSLFSKQLLTFDAILTTQVLNLFHMSADRVGNIINTAGQHVVIILRVCSPFTNISLAMLGWVAVTRTLFPVWQKIDLWVGLLLAVTIIVSNTIRISIMAVGIDYYHFMHTGYGKDIYEMVVLVITLLFILWTRKLHARANSHNCVG